MIKDMVAYLVQHPEVIDQVKAGKANLIGLSETEQKAVLDVFNNRKSNLSPVDYWS